MLVDPARIEPYGRDETEALWFAPELVALPSSTAEVAAVMRVAHEGRIPVTPRGAGTGLSGGALPVAGGIVLSLERMDRIRAIDEARPGGGGRGGSAPARPSRRAESVLSIRTEPASR